METKKYIPRRRPNLGREEFSVILWDTWTLTMWERLLYIELCSHRALQDKGRTITMSADYLAKKFHLMLGKYSVEYLRKKINEARLGLIAKGILGGYKLARGTKHQHWALRLCDNSLINSRISRTEQIVYMRNRAALLKEQIEKQKLQKSLGYICPNKQLA